MKICFLLTQDLESPSGLGRYLPWATELAKHGYEVNIITLHPDFKHLNNKKDVINGVPVNYIAQMHVKKTGNLKTYYPQWKLLWIVALATIKLAFRTIREPVDVIIIGKPHPMNSIAALFNKFIKPNIQIILDCDDYESASNRFQTKWQKRVVEWFENTMPKKAQVVTSNTYYTLGRLEQSGVPKEKLVYIPNGIDIDRFKPPDIERVAALRASLGLSGKKVILYIGSMSLINHPVDILLHAFRLVHEEMPETILLLVGAGEDLNTLKDLAKKIGVEKDVIFVGRVPPGQVPLYYALSDVSVDPVNDDEAARGRCPLKLFESWACGVPFITGDVGDRKTLLNNPQGGIVTDTFDPASYALIIIKMLKDYNLVKSIVEFGQENLKNFYWSNIIQNILPLLPREANHPTNN